MIGALGCPLGLAGLAVAFVRVLAIDALRALTPRQSERGAASRRLRP